MIVRPDAQLARESYARDAGCDRDRIAVAMDPMALAWTKQTAEHWTATAGPFLLEARDRGDGRWLWQVTIEGGRDAQATGVARSLGAAKSVSEQYVMRSGKV